MAYERNPISAPYAIAVMYEVAYPDRITKKYTKSTMTNQAVSQAMRLSLIDPASTITRSRNSRIVNCFTTYPSHMKSPRMIVAYQARRERRMFMRVYDK